MDEPDSPAAKRQPRQEGVSGNTGQGELVARWTLVPRLSFTLNGSHCASLSWLISNYALESASHLGVDAIWAVADSGIVTNPPLKTIQLMPTNDPQRFFRLRRIESTTGQ